MVRVTVVAAVALVVLAVDLAYWAPAAPAKESALPAPTSAQPGLMWRSGGLILRLTDRACPFEELAADLETEGIAPARAYQATQGGRSVTGCWVRGISGDVLTRQPGGDLGTIPLDWFSSGPGT